MIFDNLFIQLWAAVGEYKASVGGDNGKPSMFVARSWDTLEKVLRDCDLHHLPLLTRFRRSTDLPNLSSQLISNFSREPILPRPSSWKLVGDGSTELAKKGCLVRVMIHAPRKGVLDSGAIIYLPLPSDIDSYSSSYVPFVITQFLKVLYVIGVHSMLSSIFRAAEWFKLAYRGW